MLLQLFRIIKISPPNLLYFVHRLIFTYVSSSSSISGSGGGGGSGEKYSHSSLKYRLKITDLMDSAEVHDMGGFVGP